MAITYNVDCPHLWRKVEYFTGRDHLATDGIPLRYPLARHFRHRVKPTVRLIKNRREFRLAHHRCSTEIIVRSV